MPNANITFSGSTGLGNYVLATAASGLLNLDVAVVGVPTVREVDGLAMSSRNRFLDPMHRELAGTLSAVLLAAAYALDPANAERLWELSLDLIG